MSTHELILTNSLAQLPEAFREAALTHLCQATQNSMEYVRALMQEPHPVIAKAPNEDAARKLQAQIGLAGWTSDIRLIAAPTLAPPSAPATAQCQACGHINAQSAKYCAQCGTAVAPHLQPLSSTQDSGVLQATASKVAALAGLPGVQVAQRFSVGDLLFEVFKKRSTAEVEDYLLAGTLRATPRVSDMQTDWPRPWLFARVFASALMLYAIFHVAWHLFGNPNLLPAMMVVGSFVVPFSALLLFYEFNTPRNVSLMLLIKLVMLGGAWSLLISLVLFQLGRPLTGLLGASAAGLIEEAGKLAAVLFATRQLSPVRYRYTLNGILFGAAVGTGFSAFESAGYAFRALLANGKAGDMIDLIMLRGVLSPFGHVVWTALAAGALWRVKGAMSSSSIMLSNGKFLRILLVSIFCHVVWNSPLVLFHPLVKYVVLAFLAWVVLLSLVQDGLRQVQREQACLPDPGKG